MVGTSEFNVIFSVDFQWHLNLVVKGLVIGYVASGLECRILVRTWIHADQHLT